MHPGIGPDHWCTCQHARRLHLRTGQCVIAFCQCGEFAPSGVIAARERNAVDAIRTVAMVLSCFDAPEREVIVSGAAELAEQLR